MALIIFHTFCLIFGGWNIGLGLGMNTKNFLSAMVFKIVPVLAGLFMVIYTLCEIL